MFTKEGIRSLHNWTHELIDLLLEHTKRLPTELFTREVPGFGHGSVRDQLIHIVACEASWVRGLQNLAMPEFRWQDYSSVSSVVEARRRVAADTQAYLDRLSEGELNTELEHYPKEWVGPGRSPAFILHHVLTHAFHHKGQIVAMLRLLGHPAPDTDLQRD